MGYVNKTLLQQHIPPASLAEKVKIYICGPPGQVSALAGKKDGMKQGALAGLLKELGYTEEQVSAFSPGICFVAETSYLGLQVLEVEWKRRYCTSLLIINPRLDTTANAVLES